jgi:peptide/nickel transport system permease protein
MSRLVARRLAMLVPVLLLVSFGVFMLLALVPGDPAVTLAGGTSASPDAIAHVRAQLHLNDPLLVQYGHWLGGVIHLDFGRSLITGIPVAHEISSRLPVTLSLVAAATVVALIVGVPLGIASGSRPGGAVDAGARLISSLGIAIPSFWLAVILVSVFAVHWRIFPPSGFTRLSASPGQWARDITLPAVALGLLVAASLARQLRAGIVDVLHANYIRTAWAKGASPRTVIVRHALQNAAIPAVTVLGVQIGYLLGGAVIIEQIFSIPGVGSYMLQAITSHDLPVVQGVTLVFVVFQTAMSLLVDVSYGFLNPKVRVT